MKASRLFACAFALALVGSPTLSARAASDVEMEEAKALLRDGERAFKAGEYEKARVKFSAAYGVIPSVDILWNIATSEFKAGRAVESLKHFRQYIHDTKARPERKKEAEVDYVPAALKQAGHVDVVAPDGAAITVDSASVGTTPLSDGIDLQPGAHKIAARLGDKTDVQDVSAAPGQAITVKFLGSGAGPVVAVGPDPAVPAVPAAGGIGGSHVEPPVEPDRGSHWGTGKIVTVAGLGVGALVSGGVAILMFGDASSKDDEAAKIRASNPAGCAADATTLVCRQLQTKLDDRDSSNSAGGIFVGGAVAFATGAIVAAILYPNTKDARVGNGVTRGPSTGWLLPFATPTSGGVSFGNRF
jgi:hypothetical protein